MKFPKINCFNEDNVAFIHSKEYALENDIDNNSKNDWGNNADKPGVDISEFYNPYAEGEENTQFHNQSQIKNNENEQI